MYTFQSHVRYSECDKHGLLSLEGLIDYLQDCSTFQSEHLGIGIDHMKKNHIAWFISAWQIWIDRLPRFTESISVSTWSTGVKRTSASRNFTIVDAEGDSCVRADSLWFVYDTEAHRPIRIPDSEHVYDEGDAPLDLPPTQRKLPVEGPYREGSPIVVTEQHLDTNGHVNNAQYIRMAASALDVPVDVRVLRVQYKLMALLGDTIVPRLHQTQDDVTVDLASPDGTTYAVVSLASK